jgi:hypothetical protein
VPEIARGQSALLGGRACPEVAFLRELKGNCVSCLMLPIRGPFENTIPLAQIESSSAGAFTPGKYRVSTNIRRWRYDR